MYTQYTLSDNRPRPQAWAAREFDALAAWAPADRERIAALSVHELRTWAHSGTLHPSTGQVLRARGDRHIVPRDPSACVASDTPWNAPLRDRWAMGWATKPLGSTTLARTLLAKMIGRVETFQRETYYMDNRGRNRARLLSKAPRNLSSDRSLKGVSQHTPKGEGENTRRPRAQQYSQQRVKRLDGSQKIDELKDRAAQQRKTRRGYLSRTNDPRNLGKSRLLPPRNADELISYLDSRGLAIKNENPAMALDELASRLERIAWEDARHTLAPDHRDIPSKTLADAERQGRRAAEFVMDRWNPQYLENVKRRARKGGLHRTWSDEQLATVAHLSKREAALALGCSESKVARYRREQRERNAQS
ncbi:hypothetical protein ACFU0W_11715 [Microbacterium keratanolyticum]|uniref:hypothetical protein n=1 Tax=Microbacterium keratanolyticum TaxID=67574 RepID=UPI00362BDFC6